MNTDSTHHDPTPSIAALRKKGKVTNAAQPHEEDFQHPVKPSMYALDEAKRVEVGRKYWEQKENWEPMDSVDWRDLKSAKDFEIGIGNKLFRNGTLSSWTDDQIKTLQREMENTLALTDDENEKNDNKSDKNNNSSLKPRHHTSIENASTATVLINNDVSISLSMEAASLLQSQISASYGDLPPPSPSGGGGNDSGSEFVDNIAKQNKKGKKNRKNKNKTGIAHSPQGTDLALLDIASEIERQKQVEAQSAPSYKTNDNGPSTNISKEMATHRRTRTEALRLKLSDMEKRLKYVQADLSKATEEIDTKSQDLEIAESRLAQDARTKEQNKKLQTELSALTGALKSAQAELEEAEVQISRKDQENANLQRELSICKQLNQELIGKTDDGSGTGLTADDLLNSRIADAKRFAYMLTAMQEQLEFERDVFTKRIHELEQESENKDIQLTTLYQLYNKLVEKKEKKGWFSRWLDRDADTNEDNTQMKIHVSSADSPDSQK